MGKRALRREPGRQLLSDLSVRIWKHPMGWFETHRKKREDQAARERELAKAETASQQRLQVELAASMLQAQDQARFKAEWGAWLGSLDRVQKASNATELTPEILAAIGDIPKPNFGGLTRMAIGNYRRFLHSYTKMRPSNTTENATITGVNQPAFWESVQAHVDKSLSSFDGHT